MPWRVAPTGAIIGLDIELLRGIAEDIEISRTDRFYRKLKVFEDEALSFFNNKDSKVCTRAKKEKCQIEFGDFIEWACKECECNKDRGKGQGVRGKEEKEHG